MCLLSVFPCRDVEDMALTAYTTVTVPHRDEDKSPEICSPLCVCTCCSVTRLAPVRGHDVKINVAYISVSYHVRGDKSPEKVAFSIWQPPKVS